MYRKVTSNIVLKSELASMLQSTAQSHGALAQHIPGRDREIYSAGFYAAIAAIATAYGLDGPEQRPVESQQPPTRYDMQL
ncbi:MAG: hypothetical protein KF753_05085 [Caldilineaceae bacterium]|nr:hypothetical protein [Caldilineaceae bacterium]